MANDSSFMPPDLEDATPIPAQPIDVVRAQLRNMTGEADPGIDVPVAPMDFMHNAASYANSMGLGPAASSIYDVPENLTLGQQIQGLMSPPVPAPVRALYQDQPVPTSGFVSVPGTDLLSNSGPQTVMQNVGSTVTTTPQNNPQLNASIAKQQQIQVEAAQQAEAAKVALAVADKMAEPLDQARAARAQLTADSVGARLAESERRYNQARDDASKFRAEMASQDWGSYWGSKGTGDKILLSLAVGLGAYGQTKIGGQNVALNLINGFVKEHDDLRSQKFQALKDQFSAASSDSLNILSGADKLNAMDEASKLADLDVIQKQLEGMRARAKTIEAQQKIDDQLLSFKLASEQKLGDTFEKMSAKSVTTKDMFSPTVVTTTPGEAMTVNEKGQKVPMSQDQATVFNYGMHMLSAEKLASDLEDGAHVLQNPKYRYLYSALQNEAQGSVGQTLSDAERLTRLNGIADAASNGDPNLREYGRQLIRQAYNQTRIESQGTIGKGELAQNLMFALSVPLEDAGSAEAQQTSLINSRATRRGWVDGSLRRSGSRDVPFYRKATK